ncbi:MAG: carbohydrate-binding family 9-like protein [Planctomycetota bacterium]
MRALSIMLLMAFVCLISIPANGGPAARPSYDVYRLPAAPTLDGEVENDPAWKAIPAASGFHALGGEYTVAKQATALAGWTDEALHIAMTCEEPDIALIKDALKDGDPLWKDNGVEIFLQLPGKPEVFQFCVNTIGSHAMGEGKVDISKWQAAAKKGTDFWSLEIKIPFACIETRPTAGTVWRGAFCRNIWEYKSGGDKFTTWPALKTRFREPENFAAWTFRDKALSAEEAAQITAKINAAYRARLAAQIKELAGVGTEYEAPIARAAAAERFKAEAEKLREAWLRIKSLARDAQGAPLPEMRRFIAQAEDLKRRSYETKYRCLIEELLE